MQVAAHYYPLTRGTITPCVAEDDRDNQEEEICQQPGAPPQLQRYPPELAPQPQGEEAETYDDNPSDQAREGEPDPDADDTSDSSSSSSDGDIPQDSHSEPKQRKRSAGHGSQRFKNKGQKSDVKALMG